MGQDLYLLTEAWQVVAPIRLAGRHLHLSSHEWREWVAWLRATERIDPGARPAPPGPEAEAPWDGPPDDEGLLLPGEAVAKALWARAAWPDLEHPDRIPLHKLQGQDGWVLNPGECRQLLRWMGEVPPATGLAGRWWWGPLAALLGLGAGALGLLLT